jgi:hypothetical protein
VIRVTFGFETAKGERFSKEEIFQQFVEEIHSIEFIGLSNKKSIKPALTGDLMNLSLFFRKEKLSICAHETEICLALALINDNKVTRS